MTCTIYERSQGGATEYHLTAVPESGVSVFAEVAYVLRRHGARLLHERVFVQSDDVAALAKARADAYGDLDDGVPATWLRAPAGRHGPIAAVQVHAVAGTAAPTTCNGHSRILRHPGASLVTVSALTAEHAGGVPQQVRQVFDEVGSHLAHMGASMDRIARTWLWLDPIYTWYRDLNQERNACFARQGLIAADGRPIHLPASTGIGLHPLRGDIALEAIATIDGPSPTTLAAGGKQNCALNYGSAFSRAATLRTPSGDTCYVSGTAAIDAAGKTVFLGDREGQVADTIRNVRAVLGQLGVSEADVVQGVAYCIDPEVVAIWKRLNPGWSLAVVLADICRDDLLFEIECAACPGSRRSA